MQHLGNYTEDYATLNFKFSTHKADGTPIALTDGAISVYKANSTTQSTAGITLTADFDSVTGINNVLIDLSADAFYAVGNDYSVVITAGTVDGVSVVGTVLAHFSIENRFNEMTLADKTGFSLLATGADSILKSSTFIQAIAAAIKELDTYGLEALNALLTSTGIKAASIPAATLAENQHVIVDSGTVTTLTNAPTDMALNSTVAKEATAAKDATVMKAASYTAPPTVEQIQSGLATTQNVANAVTLIEAAITAAVPDVPTDDENAAAVWAYASRTITSAPVILPVIQGQVYTATAIQGAEVVIVQGDTPTITFDFDDDYTGWTPYFGAKAALADTVYAIDPKAGTWIDDALGQGTVVLTAAETATVGKYYAEIELRNGTQCLTAMKFTLKIIGEVIKASE